MTNPAPHKAGHPNGKNPGDVWAMATAGLREAHFATYPLGIPAGSRPGGIVLDPFSGAATTGLAALQLGRRYIGIDLNPDYHALAVERIARHAPATNSSLEDGHGGVPRQRHRRNERGAPR